MKTDSGYIAFIETLRAIAALVVLTFHFISFHNGSSFIVQSESLREISEYGAQGVELFYLISGFLIVYSLDRKNYVIRDYFRYMWKRIIRIMPAYWGAIALILWVNFVLAFFWEHDPTFDGNNIVANLFFMVGVFEGTSWINPVFVTLSVEFQFYILIGLLYPFLRKNLFLKYGTMAAWLVGGYFTQTEYSVLVNAPFFIVGILVCDVVREGHKVHLWVALSLVIALLARNYVPEDLLIALVGIAMFLWLKPNWKVSNWIGNFSYSLYLTHGVFGGWFLYFMSREEHVGQSDWWIILPAFVVSLVGAYVFYRVIEKPAIQWSRRINM